MSSALDSEAPGLGYASMLLQAQLGFGGVMGAVSMAARTSPSFQKALEGASWEPSLRAAAAAVEPVPAMAAFALVQAYGAAPDALTRLGLLVSTAAVVAGMALALVGGVVEDGSKGAAAVAKLGRAAGAVRAYGRALLVFGALPTGAQLLCASVLLRVVLVVGAARDVMSAVSLANDKAAQLVRELDDILSVAPVLAGVALLEHITWGASGMVWALAQPSVFLLLEALLTCGAGGSGPMGAALRAAMAVAGLRALAGAIHVEGSSARLAVQWGEPLIAAASLLAVLLIGVEIARGSAGKDASADGAEDAPKTVSAMELAHAIVLPAGGLLLAMITAHTTTPEASIFELPFKFGFAFAAGAVWIQVALLVGHSMMGGKEADVPVDAIGTVSPKTKQHSAKRSMESIQTGVLILLQGGLLLGCLGLGFLSLVAAGAGTVGAMYALATAEGRERAHKIATEVGAGIGSCVGDMMEKRRLAAEAEAARRAAAIAEALEHAEKKKSKVAGIEKASAPQTAAGAGAAGAPKGGKKEGGKKKGK